MKSNLLKNNKIYDFIARVFKEFKEPVCLIKPLDYHDAGNKRQIRRIANPRTTFMVS